MGKLQIKKFYNIEPGSEAFVIIIKTSFSGAFNQRSLTEGKGSQYGWPPNAN